LPVQVKEVDQLSGQGQGDPTQQVRHRKRAQIIIEGTLCPLMRSALHPVGPSPLLQFPGERSHRQPAGATYWRRSSAERSYAMPAPISPETMEPAQRIKPRHDLDGKTPSEPQPRIMDSTLMRPQADLPPGHCSPMWWFLNQERSPRPALNKAETGDWRQESAARLKRSAMHAASPAGLEGRMLYTDDLRRSCTSTQNRPQQRALPGADRQLQGWKQARVAMVMDCRKREMRRGLGAPPTTRIRFWTFHPPLFGVFGAGISMNRAPTFKAITWRSLSRKASSHSEQDYRSGSLMIGGADL